jgi:hypothetical protein
MQRNALARHANEISPRGDAVKKPTRFCSPGPRGVADRRAGSRGRALVMCGSAVGPARPPRAAWTRRGRRRGKPREGRRWGSAGARRSTSLWTRAPVLRRTRREARSWLAGACMPPGSRASSSDGASWCSGARSSIPPSPCAGRASALGDEAQCSARRPPRDPGHQHRGGGAPPRARRQHATLSGKDGVSVQSVAPSAYTRRASTVELCACSGARYRRGVSGHECASLRAPAWR